jgi:hypothetical protein
MLTQDSIKCAVHNLYIFQAFGVFGLCQLHALVDYIRSKMSKEYFDILFKALVTAVISISVLASVILTITGKFLRKNQLQTAANPKYHFYRKNKSMDRTFLFTPRSIIRQKSHSNYCLRFRTSTHIVVIFLL